MRHRKLTVHRRPDGRWQGSIQVRGTRHYVYGRTKKEAQRKLRRLAERLDVYLPGDAHTVRELLERWVEVKSQGWSLSTLEGNQTVIRKYILPAFGHMDLYDVTPERVQALYTQLHQQGQTRTAQKVHSILKRAFRMAVVWRWLYANPCDLVISPSHVTSRHSIWDLDQLHRFLEAAKDDWLFPFFYFLISTGARVGEATGLEWDDINWGAQRVTIQRSMRSIHGQWIISEPKTKAGKRTISLSPETVALLRLQRERQTHWKALASSWWDRDLVFTSQSGKPLHRYVPSRSLKNYCDRLRIPRIRLHDLRHLHASLLLDAGVPVPVVAARLGHAGPEVTLRIYAHMIRHDDAEAADVISSLLQ